MGPKSDVDRIKEIYRAEREAERIVRRAEEAAKALVADAEAAAGAARETKRAESDRRARELLETELAEIERAARVFLDASRLRTEEWVRRSERSIDDIADALVDRILPP